MLYFLPSIPYPPSGNGYWSPVSSTLNWCEEDYYVTIYSAEIINSITNLSFLYLAYKGISSCIRNGHETVFLVGFVSYFFIGFGSFLFHSSLRYSMQLLDELSMIYTSCIMFYATFSHRRSAQVSILIGLLAFSIAASITAYYHYIQNPVFHQNAFALITAVVFFRSLYIMETTLRPSLRKQHPQKEIDIVISEDSESFVADIRDLKILRTMWTMAAVGLGSLGVGFTIWNLDNAFCPLLRRWRQDVGLPWGILLEGHGWWHIFTGIAQYINLTWSIWLRYCIDDRQSDVQLIWPSTLVSMPAVERVDGASKTQKGD